MNEQNTITLFTRHSKDFDPLHALDFARRPYLETYGDRYSQLVSVLGGMIGCDQFIWCVDKTLNAYETIKPIEWVIRVEPQRILGYVDSSVWDRLLDAPIPIQDCSPYIQTALFSSKQVDKQDMSVIVPSPLLPCELVTKRYLRRRSNGHAEIEREEDFRLNLISATCPETCP